MTGARCLIVGLGCVLALGPVAAAQPLDTAGATQCEVRGYAKDPDPKGTNIRSAPRADAPIIGRVAPMMPFERNLRAGVDFDIVGSKDGWLLIQNGKPAGGLKLDAAHEAEGRGWISAKLVGTTLGMPAFRSAPRRDAPEIAKMAGANWRPDSVNVSAVHGCTGKYIEVTATPVGGKPVRGWSWSPCAAQFTTCDRGGMVE